MREPIEAMNLAIINFPSGSAELPADTLQLIEASAEAITRAPPGSTIEIGGQHAAYIVKALQAYKSGERSHPSMRAIAADLSDKDMADLAAYYASGPAQTARK